MAPYIPFPRDVSIDLLNGYSPEAIHVWLARFRIRNIQDIKREFGTFELDRNALLLTFASAPISPIHEMRLKGREIVAAEDPRLHLISSYNRVFLKPFPPYLLLFDFWTEFLDSLAAEASLTEDQETIMKPVLGYLYSWCQLIQHESDFRIARNLELFPRELMWGAFRELSSKFMASITFQRISGRYRLGELDLLRLNLIARPLFGRSKYYNLGQPSRPINWPHFFVGAFALVSVILSAMQVVLAAEPSSPSYAAARLVFRWTSIVFLLFFCFGLVALLVVGVYSLVQEWFTFKERAMRGFAIRRIENSFMKQKAPFKAQHGVERLQAKRNESERLNASNATQEEVPETEPRDQEAVPEVKVGDENV